ncbi:MAG TPA: DUF6090 family protein [Robiginitalea sp.]|nr:DUF6090 family protein [Robiginitalea sp.]
MKRLFATIRRRLLENGQSGKYLRYAIGEIILVMIGILLALQVNNWNERRKELKQGELLLHNIRREFLQNQQMLDTVLELNQEAYEAHRVLLDLMGAEAALLAEHNLDSLLYFALNSESYLPARHTIDDALRSGRIDLIGNEKIKNTLLQWGTDLDLIQAYKDIQANWQNQQMVPFMNRYISLLQTERYGRNPWYRPSKIPFEYGPLFESLEFENILDNNIWLLHFIIERLQDIRQTQVEVLELTATPGA